MNYLENEKRQLQVEQHHIDKGSTWQGDKVSDIIFSLSKKYISGKVLDVGAGTGSLLEILDSKGYLAEGIDLCPKNELIEQGVITDMPFSNKEFKTIFCTEVLEHLTNEQIDKGLDEVNRVLSDKGYFIITTPFNEDLTLSRYECPDCKKTFHPFGHLQSFNLDRLAKILNNKGFEIISKEVIPLNLMSKLFGSEYYYKILSKLIDSMGYTKTIFIVSKKIKENKK